MMAWNRTGMAVLVNALVVLRAGAQGNAPLILALGGVLLAAAGAAVACGVWRARRLAAGGDPATPWLLVVATVGIAWLATVAGIGAIAATLP
jgi:hypothetical protein